MGLTTAFLSMQRSLKDSGFLSDSKRKKVIQYCLFKPTFLNVSHFSLVTTVSSSCFNLFCFLMTIFSFSLYLYFMVHKKQSLRSNLFLYIGNGQYNLERSWLLIIRYSKSFYNQKHFTEIDLTLYFLNKNFLFQALKYWQVFLSSSPHTLKTSALQADTQLWNS